MVVVQFRVVNISIFDFSRERVPRHLVSIGPLTILCESAAKIKLSEPRPHNIEFG
jgi:hypothetical protein